MQIFLLPANAMTPKKALERAIKKAGTQTALAVLIGGDVKTGHIYYWLKNGVVPAEHCPAIERGTGIRCEDLCPGTDWAVLRTAPNAALAAA